MEKLPCDIIKIIQKYKYEIENSKKYQNCIDDIESSTYTILFLSNPMQINKNCTKIYLYEKPRHLKIYSCRKCGDISRHYVFMCHCNLDYMGFRYATYL